MSDAVIRDPASGDGVCPLGAAPHDRGSAASLADTRGRGMPCCVSLPAFETVCTSQLSVVQWLIFSLLHLVVYSSSFITYVLYYVCI